MTRCESYPPCFGTIYFPTAPFLFVRKKLVNKTRVCKNRHETDAEAS